MNLKTKNNKNLGVFSPSGCIEVLSIAKYQAAETENGKNVTQNTLLNESRFTSDIFSVAELPLSGFDQDDHKTSSSMPFIPVVSAITYFSKVFVIVSFDSCYRHKYVFRVKLVV